MDIAWYLVVSALIFCIGAAGVLMRRNPLVILLCLELMLNAGNLALVAFARMHGNADGQIFALIVMVVAACEVTVGLGLIVAMYRRRLPIDVDELRELHGMSTDHVGLAGPRLPARRDDRHRAGLAGAAAGGCRVDRDGARSALPSSPRSARSISLQGRAPTTRQSSRPPGTTRSPPASTPSCRSSSTRCRSSCASWSAASRR